MPEVTKSVETAALGELTSPAILLTCHWQHRLHVPENSECCSQATKAGPQFFPLEPLTRMASSRVVGMSSTLRYASTVDIFLPAVEGAALSLLFRARMVS